MECPALFSKALASCTLASAISGLFLSLVPFFGVMALYLSLPSLCFSAVANAMSRASGTPSAISVAAFVLSLIGCLMALFNYLFILSPFG